ncbi:MAG TPA: DUF2267 domain-containing protein, partial [Steroidobacteraceae bacterium]
IVTDRDLAVRVLGRGLDAQFTRVGSVMTSPVVTLSPSDDQSEAVRLMQEKNIRRIPLVEDGRMVGMVTLDDLLLDETVTTDQVAAIVAAQIGMGGIAPSPRTPAARRSAARAQATYGRLRNQLQAEAGLENPEQADTALKVVLDFMVRRLTADEAKDLISQLPSLLQTELRRLPPGPDKQITREAIEAELVKRLDISPQRAAEILNAVGAKIAQSVSAGQVEDMRRQFPEDMRSILPEPRHP